MKALCALLVAAAGDPVDEGVQFYGEGRCAEAEALLEPAAASSPRAAYFLGACRLQRGDFAGAERAFDGAAASPEWEAMARFMRGVARFRAGRAAEARADLASAASRPDLPAKLRESARELLREARAARAVHAALHAAAEGDTNALQAPEVQLPGLEVISAPALSAAAALVWETLPGLRLRGVAFHREVAAAPAAAVGGAVAGASWRSGGAPWTFEALAEAGGFLLGWSSPLGLAHARGGAAFSPGGGLRAALEGFARGREFGAPYGAQSAFELGAEMELAFERGPGRAAARLEHLSAWTRGPDFAREAETARAEVSWSFSWVIVRARAAAGLHLYRHVNTLRDREGRRTPRRDLRIEWLLGAELPLGGGVALTADAAFTDQRSSIEAYEYERRVVSAGLSYAF